MSQPENFSLALLSSLAPKARQLTERLGFWPQECIAEKKSITWLAHTASRAATLKHHSEHVEDNPKQLCQKNGAYFALESRYLAGLRMRISLQWRPLLVEDYSNLAPFLSVSKSHSLNKIRIG
jgi:hypothetical protein